MRTAKDILIVILLLILVTLTCLQEDDILKLRHRAFVVESGLSRVCGWIAQETDPVKGGLEDAKGGSGLRYFLSCSATLYVTTPMGGPISIGTRLTSGTGVFVSDNILLTAKHIVKDRINDAGVKITGPNGVTYTAMTILEDFDDDLAIVILRDRQGPWMKLGPRPSLGDDVICIGTPLRQYPQLIITWGRVSSEKYLNTFIYDGFCWPGCSGGPVITGGKLVGITESRLKRTDSLGFAVPVSRLDPSLVALIQ